ncbi:MAG: hypothetical protein VB013_07405 [Anaerolineaceae bacterium]|nr:hypothetical protein [Anaerolineaceae bacterium]
MKKEISIVLLVIMTIGGMLGNIQLTVSANPGSDLGGGKAGVWQYPDSISAVETRARNYGYPNYLQLITNALSIDQPAKICHTFNGAKSGWIPEFKQWYSYRWHTIENETTVLHDVTKDTYLACVTTPSNGVYALFAWYPVSSPTLEATKFYTNDSIDGAWNVGTKTDLNLVMDPIPAWLQLFSSGVTITEKTQICFPFAKGSAGWTPEIWQLQEGKWQKVKTELVYPSGKEGIPNACANVNAGTYALMGYLNEN